MSLKMVCESCKLPALKAGMAHIPFPLPLGKLHLCRSCATRFYLDFCSIPGGPDYGSLLLEAARLKGFLRSEPET